MDHTIKKRRPRRSLELRVTGLPDVPNLLADWERSLLEPHLAGLAGVADSTAQATGDEANADRR